MRFPAPTPIKKDRDDQTESRKAWSILSKFLDGIIAGIRDGTDIVRKKFIELSNGDYAQETPAALTIPFRDANAALPGDITGNAPTATLSADSTLTSGRNYGTICTDTKEPTGFVDPSAVTVTYDSTTKKVTLGGTVKAYWRGSVVSALISGWVSPALTDTYASPNAPYWLYYNGTAIVWSNTEWTFDMLQICYVYYTAAGTFILAVRETHGTMDWNTHEELHRTIGTYRESGGVISGVVLVSTTAANRRPLFTATIIHDEDIKTTVPSLASASYTQTFMNGTAKNFTAAAADIVPLSTARPYYNPVVSGSGSQVLMANNSYMSIWVLAAPVSADAASQVYRYLFVQGQTNGSLASEQALIPPNLFLGGLTAIIPEFVFINKIIIRYSGGDWTIAQVDTLSGSRATSTSGTSNIAPPTPGYKTGLELVYVSSDTLSLKIGEVEVNRTLVQVTSAVAITSGTTGYPSAGSWVYVTMTPAGVITLRAATGTAAQRPTDNLFQLTGGGVGYDDIGKFGYYYDADERVIAAFHKVSATAFYFINLSNETNEIGQNSNGHWWVNGRDLHEHGAFAISAGAFSGGPWSSSPFYRNISLTFPIEMATAKQKSLKWSVSDLGAATYSWTGYYSTPSSTATSFYIFSNANSSAATYAISWELDGGL